MHFVRCYMHDDDWEAHLEAKRNPVWMRYRDGCVCFYRNREDEKPFRVYCNGGIVYEGADNGA